MNNQEEVITKFKSIFLDSCGLHDKEPADVPNDGLLFGPDSCLGLDSLDSLELAMLLDAHFKIKFSGKNEEREIMKNFDSLFNYIFKEVNKDTIDNFLKK